MQQGCPPSDPVLCTLRHAAKRSLFIGRTIFDGNTEGRPAFAIIGRHLHSSALIRRRFFLHRLA
jgi:hypothetical protein